MCLDALPLSYRGVGCWFSVTSIDGVVSVKQTKGGIPATGVDPVASGL